MLLTPKMDYGPLGELGRQVCRNMVIDGAAPNLWETGEGTETLEALAWFLFPSYLV